MHKAKKNKRNQTTQEAMPLPRQRGKKIALEDKSQRAVEKAENVSPYDLLPPGPGIFPQIFTNQN